MDSPIRSPFLIESLPGYSPTIGHLVAMMNYARSTTLEAVAGLSPAELDFLLDGEANSIGMLLEHMIWVERGYQANTFGWAIEGEEVERWRLGSDLGEEGRKQIRGFDLDHYLERLKAIRDRTLAEFAKRDDAWLFEEGEWWGGNVCNNYFKWFHVFEDEINHRGQIRIIRKRLPG
ncbi:MAG TPA: DinB family protein [Trueperaceae bacterium]